MSELQVRSATMGMLGSQAAAAGPAPTVARTTVSAKGAGERRALGVEKVTTP